MTNYVGTTLNDLPPVLGLNGSELLFLYQYDSLTSTWITYQCTSEQLANLFNGGGSGQCSMRQLFAAMADQGVLFSTSEAVPSDITNSYNIAWNKAYIMSINDPFITGFLQPTLSYSSLQMAELFALAQTYPL